MARSANSPALDLLLRVRHSPRNDAEKAGVLPAFPAETFRVETRPDALGIMPRISTRLQPPGSHQPAWLANCLGLAKDDVGARVKYVWHEDNLAGVFAIQSEQWRWGLPQRVVKSWTSDLTFDGTPLLDAWLGKGALMAFLRNAKAPVLFQSIPANEPFRRMIGEAARSLHAPVASVARWERAALKPQGTFEEWFETNFERKRKKEYRRLRARLSEQGDFQSLAWSGDEPVQRWIDDLFHLEAKGWKGREGTAVSANGRVQAGLTRALHALARDGALRFWKLALNGEPIAMMFALVSDSKAFLGKIAYDEAYAKYSPGVLLILDATKALFEDGGIALADSCAIPDHPMINNIWRDRIAMEDVLIGTPRQPRALFRIHTEAESLRRRGRALAKQALIRLTRRRQS